MRALVLRHDSTRRTLTSLRWTLTFAVLAVAALARAPSLGAQVLSGTVRDSASQQPIPNTRVLTMDPAGTVWVLLVAPGQAVTVR